MRALLLADDHRRVTVEAVGVKAESSGQQPHRPWLIHTYRDLFRNVGYALISEEPFHGEKNGASLEATICLFAKPAGATPRAG